MSSAVAWRWAEVVDPGGRADEVSVTVTLPAETWELVCDSLDMDLRDQVLGEVGKSPKVEVSIGQISRP